MDHILIAFHTAHIIGMNTPLKTETYICTHYNGTAYNATPMHSETETFHVRHCLWQRCFETEK